MASHPTPTRKAIPPSRDRLQSQLLVWTCLPAFLYLCVKTGWQLVAAGGFPRTDLFHSLAISLLFALAAWRLRAATAMAALCGGMICLLLTESYQRRLITLVNPSRPTPSIFHSGLTPLFVLFVLTFASTKMGRKRKAESGLAESRKGRNSAQIIANLGMAALLASLWGEWIYIAVVGGSWSFSGQPSVFARFTAVFLVPTLAALAEATADTVSSEIGQAFGGTPRMVLTLRQVPPGTDGAITLLGTLAGIASAALIALTGIPALCMSSAECLVAFAAGVAGLFFDSLLGATLERRGWLGNDLVNFLSTAFAAALALLVVRYALSE